MQTTTEGSYQNQKRCCDKMRLSCLVSSYLAVPDNCPGLFFEVGGLQDSVFAKARLQSQYEDGGTGQGGCAAASFFMSTESIPDFV